MQAKTEVDYRALAHTRGLTWIGPELPQNSLTPTLWECAAGHQWLARYGSIYSGSGCRICAGLRPKTVEDYLALAEERGLKWVGKEFPKSVAMPTLWEFPDGKVMSYSYSNIRQHRRRKTAGIQRQADGREMKEEQSDT